MTIISNTLLGLAEVAQRFFPPHETMPMLETILPRFDGNQLNSVLAVQSFLVHFLPLSHPTEWLDTVFGLWTSMQSNYWDSQWLDLLSRLAEKHLDPSASDPRVIEDLRRRAQPADSLEVNGISEIERGPSPDPTRWPGIRRDVGIFRTSEWALLMTKCLRLMGASRCST